MGERWILDSRGLVGTDSYFFSLEANGSRLCDEGFPEDQWAKSRRKERVKVACLFELFALVLLNIYRSDCRKSWLRAEIWYLEHRDNEHCGLDAPFEAALLGFASARAGARISFAGRRRIHSGLPSVGWFRKYMGN